MPLERESSWTQRRFDQSMREEDRLARAACERLVAGYIEQATAYAEESLAIKRRRQEAIDQIKGASPNA